MNICKIQITTCSTLAYANVLMIYNWSNEIAKNIVCVLISNRIY